MKFIVRIVAQDEGMLFNDEESINLSIDADSIGDAHVKISEELRGYEIHNCKEPHVAYADLNASLGALNFISTSSPVKRTIGAYLSVEIKLVA